MLNKIKESIKSNKATFFEEIFLNSGQYILFYLVMNFSKDSSLFWLNGGHIILLIALFAQTLYLVKFGSKVKGRIIGSLIAPTVYTLVEMLESVDHSLNLVHVMMWVFSIINSAIFVYKLKIKETNKHIFAETFLTFSNIASFIFIYFYFDILRISPKIAYQNFWEIEGFLIIATDFFLDTTHIYIITGGVLLGISLSLGRIKAIQLKAKMNKLLGIYIDQKVRDKMLSGEYEKSNEKELTILFSDIRNFTALSEKESPQQVIKTLNIYLHAWSKIVQDHDGYIDKFIGDAVMIVFGLQDCAKAAENAVHASVAMLNQLPMINLELSGKGLPPITQIGVGINSGRVVLGNIGGAKRKDFTVIGDSVNTTARLESKCKDLKRDLIISENVYQNVPKNYQKLFSSLGKIALKGKKQKVSIFGLD